MNFSAFDKIKTIEGNRSLNILFLNINDIQIPIDYYKSLKDYGELFVVCKSNFQIGPLRGKLNHYGIKFILPHQIPPTIEFDIIICEQQVFKQNERISEYFKFEYVYILDDNWENVTLENYRVFYDHCFRYKYSSISNDLADTGTTENQSSNINVFEEADNKTTETEIILTEGDYEILIKDFATEPIKYDKYRINYLYPQVPGKVSIIMTISKLNDTFPDVLRDIRSQNVGLIEFIIIDNAAGFRNNIKPNIRYGQRMPLDFCEYHAKEFCTGEYMIFLTEDSPTFVVSDVLENGLYEIR